MLYLGTGKHDSQTHTPGQTFTAAMNFGDYQTILDQTEQQIREYWNGQRKFFDLPLELKGSEFQLRVWDYLCQIPYGQTCSYRDVAQAIGQRKACRAVGMANSKNPISLIIPCHRVIAANGSLGGYGGGLVLKRLLLEKEKTFEFEI